MNDHESLVIAILTAVLPNGHRNRSALDDAIRVELLLTALQDAERPTTLSGLLRVLDRISAGEVARELVALIRLRAEREPDLLLAELIPRGGRRRREE